MHYSRLSSRRNRKIEARDGGFCSTCFNREPIPTKLTCEICTNKARAKSKAKNLARNLKRHQQKLLQAKADEEFQTHVDLRTAAKASSSG